MCQPAGQNARRIDLAGQPLNTLGQSGIRVIAGQQNPARTPLGPTFRRFQIIGKGGAQGRLIAFLGFDQFQQVAPIARLAIEHPRQGIGFSAQGRGLAFGFRTRRARLGFGILRCCARGFSRKQRGFGFGRSCLRILLRGLGLQFFGLGRCKLGLDRLGRTARSFGGSRATL